MKDLGQLLHLHHEFKHHAVCMPSGSQNVVLVSHGKIFLQVKASLCSYRLLFTVWYTDLCYSSSLKPPLGLGPLALNFSILYCIILLKISDHRYGGLCKQQRKVGKKVAPVMCCTFILKVSKDAAVQSKTKIS